MVQGKATVLAGSGSHVLQQRTMNDGLTLLTGRTEVHKRLKTCWETRPPSCLLCQFPGPWRPVALECAWTLPQSPRLPLGAPPGQ